MGPLLALVFGLYLHWLPVAGWQWGSIRYLVLPVITLALPVAAYAGAPHAREPAGGAARGLHPQCAGARTRQRRACCGGMRCGRR